MRSDWLPPAGQTTGARRMPGRYFDLGGERRRGRVARYSDRTPRRVAAFAFVRHSSSRERSDVAILGGEAWNEVGEGAVTARGGLEQGVSQNAVRSAQACLDRSVNLAEYPGDGSACGHHLPRRDELSRRSGSTCAGPARFWLHRSLAREPGSAHADRRRCPSGMAWAIFDGEIQTMPAGHVARERQLTAISGIVGCGDRWSQTDNILDIAAERGREHALRGTFRFVR